MNRGIEMDMENFLDKEFYSFRKTRNYDEGAYHNRWVFTNPINQHYVRRSNQVLNELEGNDFAEKIYQVRPSLVLNIDNEFMTFKLMDQVRGKRFLT